MPEHPTSRRPAARAPRCSLALAAPLLVGLGWLALPSPSARADEPEAAVWVFFRDKGPAEGPGRLAALEARARELPARTLARRRRARGDRGVDLRDLPVNPEYIAHVEATGATVRVRSRWLDAVSVDATASERAALLALPEVARVEAVRQHWRGADPPLVTTPDVAPGMDEFGLASAQLALIGAIPLQRHCGLTGAGVVVGVQDTGFVLDHQAFAGLDVLAAHDFINDDDVVAHEPGDPGGQTGHGTLVMGTLAGSDPGTFMGVAPGISVILSKTERIDAEVPAEEDYYVAGVEWIEAQGADIFTASLGYRDWYSPEDFDGQTAVTSVALNVAFDNGLAVFASMGNSGPDPSTIGAPADAFGALAVGATTLEGVVANFSSRGPTADGRTKPDISAPGVDVASVEPGTLTQYTTWNGTSAAAPVAAGLAALVLEARPELTAQQLADVLRQTASQADAPDNDRGWGIVDGRLATGDACGCNDSDEDGLTGVLCGGEDCDDGEAAAFPGAPEQCNGRDDDCDGVVPAEEADADGDGVMVCGGDCDDDDPEVAPDRDEVCGDGIDNDCDGEDPACPPTGGTLDDGSGTGSPDDTGPAAPDDTGPWPGGTGSTHGGEGSDSGGGATEPPAGCGCTTGSGRDRGRGRDLSGPLGLLLLAAGARRRRQPRTRAIR